MTNETFLLGDHFVKGSAAMAGFNRRVLGDSYSAAFQYPHERSDHQMHAGWSLADGLINDGRIFFVHNFHHTHGDCEGHAFTYGGTWVCNTCNRSNLQKDWWRIRVARDGDSWFCLGLGFENLQESDNYAFGASREEAISKYGDVMKSKGAP